MAATNISPQVIIQRRLAAGAYGTVYEGISNPGQVPVAIKRGCVRSNINFNGSLKELDFLRRFMNDPFAITLRTISLGTPHTQCELEPFPEGFKDDLLYIILEKAAYDGHVLIHAQETGVEPLCWGMTHLLLALEKMHAEGIIHRDLKPTNLLWVRGEGNERSLKVADFGMSAFDTIQVEKSPYVVTSWYRPPEIIGGHTNYTSKADLWSVGCIFYEVLSRRALLEGLEDNSAMLLNRILHTQPKQPNKKMVTSLNKKGWVIRNNEAYTKRRMSYVERASLGNGRVTNFDIQRKDGQNVLDLFEDLLRKLLCLNPDERISATDALNHPFFDNRREYIKQVRKTFPPIDYSDYNVHIIECKERRWAADICAAIYNKRNHICPQTNEPLMPWYSHRVIFQTIDLFDRYLHYQHKKGNFKNNVVETETRGQLHDYDQVDLRIRVCLYIAIKCLVMPDLVCSFANIIHKKFMTEEYTQKAYDFECFMIAKVLRFQIYRPTVYETFPIKLNSKQTRNLLLEVVFATKISDVPLRKVTNDHYTKIVKPIGEKMSPICYSPPPVYAPQLVQPAITLVTPSTYPQTTTQEKSSTIAKGHPQQQVITTTQPLTYANASQMSTAATGTKINPIIQTVVSASRQPLKNPVKPLSLMTSLQKLPHVMHQSNKDLTLTPDVPSAQQKDHATRIQTADTKNTLVKDTQYNATSAPKTDKDTQLVKPILSQHVSVVKKPLLAFTPLKTVSKSQVLKLPHQPDSPIKPIIVLDIIG